jgi:cytochrome c peroxidase
MEGNTKALTQSQQVGLSLFVGQGNCVACHAGPELTKASVASVTAEQIEAMLMGNGSCAVYDNGFYNIGVRPTAEDIGLGGTDPFGNPLSNTGMAQLGKFPDPTGVFGACPNRINVDGTFKVPSLRNVELTGPYFHNGGQATLWHVIDFYNRGGDFAQQNIQNLDPNIGNLKFTDDQKTALVNFLLSLTDERVRWEKAPFDHPAICLPNGSTGDNLKVTPSVKGGKEAQDVMLCLPATGAGGGAKPLIPFLGMDPMSR